jgi:hypothetical protein
MYICITITQKQNQMNTHLENNLGSYLAYCEAKGIGKCFLAYAENCSTEEIMMIGFNPNSGYTYIALENGISICSSMGGDVEYLVTDMNSGEETFYDTYREAENHEENEEEENEEEENEG